MPEDSIERCVCLRKVEKLTGGARYIAPGFGVLCKQHAQEFDEDALKTTERLGRIKLMVENHPLANDGQLPDFVESADQPVELRFAMNYGNYACLVMPYIVAQFHLEGFLKVRAKFQELTRAMALPPGQVLKQDWIVMSHQPLCIIEMGMVAAVTLLPVVNTQSNLNLEKAHLEAIEAQTIWFKEEMRRGREWRGEDGGPPGTS